LDADLEVVANLYDAGGRMLGEMKHIVSADSFIGVDSFSMLENLDAGRQAEAPCGRIGEDAESIRNSTARAFGVLKYA